MQTFGDINKQIKDNLYKADAPSGSLFEGYNNQESKGSWAIIKPPRNFFGIEGLELDAEETHEIERKSIVSKHPVENKSYMAEHISNEPIIVKIEGLIGEIVSKRDRVNQAVDITTDKLSILSQYSVPFTQSTNRQIYDLQSKTNQEVDYIKKLYADGKNLTDGFISKNESEDLNRVQNVLQFLYYLKANNIPCTLSLKYDGVLKNMHITSIAEKYSKYENVLKVSLAFQQVLFVNTETTFFEDNKSETKKQIDSQIAFKGGGNSKNISRDATKSLLKKIADAFFTK